MNHVHGREKFDIQPQVYEVRCNLRLDDRLFLVTWQERDGTTVVHLEDYRMNTIITNITQPGSGTKDRPEFSTFHGTMRQIS